MSQKKLRKASSLTISIESKIFEEFEKYAEENFIDKSRLIEHLILKHIKNKDKK